MQAKFTVTGIMFESTEDQIFPTLREVAKTDHVSLYGMETDIEDAGLYDWFVIAYDPYQLHYYDKDAEAIDETNWDVIISECENTPEVQATTAYDPYRWVVIGIDDALEAGYALVDKVLIVKPEDREEDNNLFTRLERLEECLHRLQNYPLLDEEAYSEREWQAWQEYALDAFSDELWRADRNGNYPHDELDALKDRSNDLLPILGQHLHCACGFSGEYGPDFLDIYENLKKKHDYKLAQIMPEYVDLPASIVSDHDPKQSPLFEEVKWLQHRKR